LNVDVPVVDAAVDFDVAEQTFRTALVVSSVGDFDQAEHRLHGMPFLNRARGLSAFDAVAREFPVGLEPVGITHHDDEPVLYDLLYPAAIFTGGNLLREIREIFLHRLGRANLLELARDLRIARRLRFSGALWLRTSCADGGVTVAVDTAVGRRFDDRLGCGDHRLAVGRRLGNGSNIDRAVLQGGRQAWKPRRRRGPEPGQLAPGPHCESLRDPLLCSISAGPPSRAL
jgi:hypothetical protein